MTGTTAPRVDFYDGGSRHAGDPLGVAIALAAKAAAAGQRAVILAIDADQAARIDDRLWDVQPSSTFIPHSLADDPRQDVARVVIASPAHEAPACALVINLRNDPVDSDCERIIELIPPDDEGRRTARDRWRAYQSRGLKPTRIDLDAR